MEKSRFVVKQNGAERSIFTIEESSNGDLQINFSIAKNTVVKSGENIRVNRRSLTIHRSLKSTKSIRTVTHKQFLDQTMVSKGFSVFETESDEKFLWLVGVDAIGTNVPKLESKKIRRNELITRLAAYNTQLNTMFVSFLLSDRDYVSPQAFGLSQHTIKFSNFSITLLFNFVNLPTPSCGFYSTFLTAAEKTASSVYMVGQKKSKELPALSVSAIEPAMLTASYKLSHLIQVRNAQRAGLILPAKHPQFKRFPEGWSGMDLRDLAYGVGSYIGSTPNHPNMRMSPNHVGDPRFSSVRGTNKFRY